MALSTQQIAGLNALNQKIATGYKPTATDTANLDYAKKQGYTYNPLPAGATKITDPNYLKTAGLNESQIFRQGQDIYKLPQISSVDTTVDPSIKNPSIPEPEVVDNIPSLMAGLETTNKGTEAILKAQQQQLASQPKASALQTRLEEYRGEQQTAQRDLQTKTQEQFKLQENFDKLQALMPQIARLEADFNAAEIDQEGKVGSASSIYGRQALIQRQKAVELAGLSAVAQAYQGNVDLARQIAQDAVNAQYQDITNYNNNLINQLNYVYQDLTREEKVKADQLKTVIDERNRLVTEEKELKTNISNVMINAAQGGADQATINKIMNSSSYLKAIELASPYLFEDNWVESDITDSKGNPLLFNEATGEYKTAVGTSTSDIYFTDANGDKWNIAGWATDQTKPAQMDDIAKKIGKITDDNIDEKVKEFTPGITADMIKEASAMSGVSWEALMTMVAQESLGGTSSVAKNNNNFAGLTFNNQEWIKKYGGVKGTPRPSKEGGNYIKFPTKQQGLNAMADLMAQYGKVQAPEIQPTITEEGYDISKFTPKFYSTDYGQKVLNNEQQYNTNFLSQQIVKDFNTVQNKQLTMDKVLNSGVGGPGDLMAVFDFMKALDPNSVVRESEYETAAKSGNIFAGVYARFNGYLKEKGGFLPEQVKKDFVSIINNKLEASEAQYNNLRSEYRRMAYQQGLNPDNVAPNLIITPETSGQSTAEADYLKSLGFDTTTETPQTQNQTGSVWNWFRGLFGASPQMSQTEKVKSLIKK